MQSKSIAFFLIAQASLVSLCVAYFMNESSYLSFILWTSGYVSLFGWHFYNNAEKKENNLPQAPSLQRKDNAER